MERIDPKLINELKSGFTVKRLTTRGLFQNMEPPEGLETEHYSRIRLYRAVLDRALVDCFSIKEDLRDETRTWVNIDDEDFIICCERAMLEPEKVQQVFETFITILGNTTIE